MKTILTKIFLIVLIITIATALEAYTIELMNVHDDLIVALGFIVSLLIILLLILGINHILKQKQINIK